MRMRSSQQRTDLERYWDARRRKTLAENHRRRREKDTPEAFYRQERYGQSESAPRMTDLTSTLPRRTMALALSHDAT